VDEGGESNPIHLIDLIKECLQNVYDEGRVEDAPTWRQIEYFAETSTNINDGEKPAPPNDMIVNFQRKIIPVDALNLTLEDIREKKLQNAAGYKKQNLIICASLIDKIPNLGGLARTAEIFAANRLVIPDIRITKMDNFKSLTVGAHDWIDIEECNEEVSSN
jgi:tRNA G18 (ribose-2'-O)-methylase SpoU